jgi:hypothetical protein
MPNIIPQSEPPLKLVKKSEHRYSVKVSQSLKNFVASIPKHRRKNMTLRIIPKDSPEGREILRNNPDL